MPSNTPRPVQEKTSEGPIELVVPRRPQHHLPSTVALERQRVVLLPHTPDRRAHLGDAVPLAHQATAVTASASQTAALAVLHHWTRNPVDARIPTDGLVRRIHHDDLVVLVDRVVVHPVRVQHPHVAAPPTSALLSNRALVALELQLRDTLVLGLTILDTLGHRALAATAANPNAVDDKALLRLVSQTARLVRPRRPRCAVDGRQVAELPCPNAEKEAEHVTLLFAPQLLKVLVRTHGCDKQQQQPPRMQNR
eukprot:contig_18003_g4409